MPSPLNVKYKADNEVKQTFLLLQKDGGTLDIPSDTDWVFPDAGGNGYYRWQTSLEQFSRLVDDIDELTDREKIAVLGNSEALLNAGKLSLADYMFVINTLIRERHPLVFLPALEKLITIGHEFVDTRTEEAFARFVDSALTDRFREVGIERRPADSEAIIQMRPRLLRALGQFGSNAAVRKAAALLTDEYFERDLRKTKIKYLVCSLFRQPKRSREASRLLDLTGGPGWRRNPGDLCVRRLA